MHNYYVILVLMKPVSHASHYVGYQGEWRRVMIRKRVMVYPAIYLRIRVSRALGSEFPYSPIILVFVVEELDQSIKRVAVRSLRVRP